MNSNNVTHGSIIAPSIPDRQQSSDRVYDNDGLRRRDAFLDVDFSECSGLFDKLAAYTIRSAEKFNTDKHRVGPDLLNMTNPHERALLMEGYSKTFGAIYDRVSGMMGNVDEKRGRSDSLYQSWVIDAQLETDAEWFGGLKPTHLIQPFILRIFHGVRDYKVTYPKPFQNREYDEKRFILFNPVYFPTIAQIINKFPEWADCVLLPDTRTDHGEASSELWEAILKVVGVSWVFNSTGFTQPILNLEILHFWSAGDLRALIGDKALHGGMKSRKASKGGERVINPSVSAKRVTRIDMHLSPRVRVTSNDCSGIGQGGLEDKQARVGLSTETKHLVTKTEKARFDEVALNDPERFIGYSLGDVGQMAELQYRESTKLKKIAHEVLGIRYRASGDNSIAISMPKSTGSCVAGILEAFVLDRLSRDWKDFGDDKRVDYNRVGDVIKSTGNLVPTLGQSELRGVEKIHKLNEGIPLLKWKNDVKNGGVRFDISEYEDEAPSIYHRRSRFINTILDGGASTTLAFRADSGVGLAVVAGGRCNNERPYKLGWKGSWINPDMSGCYGNALKDFEYPVGKPKIWTKEGVKEGLSLGDFIKRFSPELVDNLWVASLDCSQLPFEQDLLYSKPMDALAVRKAVLNYLKTDDIDYGDPDENPWLDLDAEAHEQYQNGGSEPSIKRLPSEYILLRQELINAPLTSNSLEILKAVCTKAEWSKLLKTVFVSAVVYYPKSERVSMDEYSRRMETHVLEYQEYDTASGTVQAPKRPEFWASIPLAEFVGPLLDERKKIKKAMKAANTPEERELLNGEQTFLKLIINTTYGVLCSIFFDVSNAVLASNITDRARCGAWQMAKALGCVHTITDGGYFDADQVPVLAPKEGRKVGMEGLATMFLAKDGRWVKEWKSKHQCDLKTKSLDLPDGVKIPEMLANLRANPGKTIGQHVGNNWDDRCSDLVLNTILEFWKPYGLGFNYGIENKDTEYTDCLTYFGRSDYFFLDHKGVEQAKIRGTKKGGISEFPDEMVDGRFKLSAAKLLPNVDRETLPETINNEPVKRRFMRAIHKFIQSDKWVWDCKDVVGLQPAVMKLALWQSLNPDEVAPNCNYHKVLRNFGINNIHFPILDYKTAKRIGRRFASRDLFEKYLDKSPTVMVDMMRQNRL